MWVMEDFSGCREGRAPYGRILAHMKKTFGFLVALEQGQTPGLGILFISSSSQALGQGAVCCLVEG